MEDLFLAILAPGRDGLVPGIFPNTLEAATRGTMAHHGAPSTTAGSAALAGTRHGEWNDSGPGRGRGAKVER